MQQQEGEAFAAINKGKRPGQDMPHVSLQDCHKPIACCMPHVHCSSLRPCTQLVAHHNVAFLLHYHLSLETSCCAPGNLLTSFCAPGKPLDLLLRGGEPVHPLGCVARKVIGQSAAQRRGAAIALPASTSTAHIMPCMSSQL
jgi:hypothetical protein